MSEQSTRNVTKIENLTVGVDLATTDEIKWEEYVHGSIIVPSGQTLASITWFGAERQANEPAGAGTREVNSVSGLDQNYVLACDAAGLPMTQSLTGGRGYALPAALAGYASLKAVGNVAGTLIVVLKS